MYEKRLFTLLEIIENPLNMIVKSDLMEIINFSLVKGRVQTEN